MQPMQLQDPFSAVPYRTAGIQLKLHIEILENRLAR